MKVVLFDGLCVMCNHLVDFVVKRDSKKIIHFASQQSEFGKKLIQENGYLDKIGETLFFLDEDEFLLRSSAAIKLFSYLDSPWKYMTVFNFIPVFIRDFVYNVTAKYRYRLFGKRDACRIYSPEEKDRFLS